MIGSARVEPAHAEVTSAAEVPIRWVGAGIPVFVGAVGAGGGDRTEPRRFASSLEIEAAFGTAGAGTRAAGTRCRRALAAFFESGGDACYVLDTPYLERPGDERAVALFIGEDGGSGYRTGLHALGDLDDCGAIVVPGILDALWIGVLVEYVVLRPSRFLVLEDAAGDPPVEIVERVLAAVGPRRDGAGDPRECIGSLVADETGAGIGHAVGAHMASGFDPERPHRAARPLPPELEVRTCARRSGTLREWLCREGLRRSLDAGTRWVLFEVLDPFLERRVEREVRAFLLRLFDAGFFAAARAEEAFSVRCDASLRDPSRADSAVLDLVVEARLGGGVPAVERAQVRGDEHGEKGRRPT